MSPASTGRARGRGRAARDEREGAPDDVHFRVVGARKVRTAPRLAAVGLQFVHLRVDRLTKVQPASKSIPGRFPASARDWEQTLDPRDPRDRRGTAAGAQPRPRASARTCTTAARARPPPRDRDDMQYRSGRTCDFIRPSHSVLRQNR
jgi:hypothetical protein